jgi:hypothetical protein
MASSTPWLRGRPASADPPLPERRRYLKVGAGPRWSLAPTWMPRAAPVSRQRTTELPPGHRRPHPAALLKGTGVGLDIPAAHGEQR